MVIQKKTPGHCDESTMARTTVVTKTHTSIRMPPMMRVLSVPLPSWKQWKRKPKSATANGFQGECDSPELDEDVEPAEEEVGHLGGESEVVHEVAGVPQRALARVVGAQLVIDKVLRRRRQPKKRKKQNNNARRHFLTRPDFHWDRRRGATHVFGRDEHVPRHQGADAVQHERHVHQVAPGTANGTRTRTIQSSQREKLG